MSSTKKNKDERLPYFDKQDAITVAILILVTFLVFMSIQEQEEAKEPPAKEEASGWQQPSPGDTTAQEIITSPPFR
jgi:hypothetical protein